MPREEIFHQFKEGTLRSGSGGKVTNPNQAKAIAMSYKPAAQGGGKIKAKTTPKSKPSRFNKQRSRSEKAALAHKIKKTWL